MFLTNHQFSVSIGADTYGFSKISNLIQEMEYDSIAEGGRNSGPVLFQKPKSRLDTLTLEQGVRISQPVLRGQVLAVGIHLQNVVVLIGDKENGYLNYTFDEGIVTKIELDNLDGMGNSVLIRKIEIAHTGLLQMQ